MYTENAVNLLKKYGAIRKKAIAKWPFGQAYSAMVNGWKVQFDGLESRHIDNIRIHGPLPTRPSAAVTLYFFTLVHALQYALKRKVEKMVKTEDFQVTVAVTLRHHGRWLREELRVWVNSVSCNHWMANPDLVRMARTALDTEILEPLFDFLSDTFPEDVMAQVAHGNLNEFGHPVPR